MRKNGTIVASTADEAKQMMTEGEARINRAKIAAMTEEELEASIDEEDEGRFDNSVFFTGMPGVDGLVYLRIDDDVVNAFMDQGLDYARRMNDVLRAYIDSHDTTSSGAE